MKTKKSYIVSPATQEILFFFHITKAAFNRSVSYSDCNGLVFVDGILFHSLLNNDFGEVCAKPLKKSLCDTQFKYSYLYLKQNIKVNYNRWITSSTRTLRYEKKNESGLKWNQNYYLRKIRRLKLSVNESVGVSSEQVNWWKLSSTYDSPSLLPGNSAPYINSGLLPHLSVTVMQHTHACTNECPPCSMACSAGEQQRQVIHAVVTNELSLKPFSPCLCHDSLMCIKNRGEQHNRWTHEKHTPSWSTG